MSVNAERPNTAGSSSSSSAAAAAAGTGKERRRRGTVREISDDRVAISADDVVHWSRSAAVVVGVSFRCAYPCAAAERHPVPAGRFSQHLRVTTAAAEADTSIAAASSLFSLY